MSDRSSVEASFFDRTKQFAHHLPHGLSQPARSTAIMLFMFAGPDGTGIFVSVEALMDLTALSKSAQFRALKELMKAGYLLEDGWHSYGSGVKTRKRRLMLRAMMAARAEERAANHSATGGTVGDEHSATNDVFTVPLVGHKPSIEPPIKNTPIIPAGSQTLPGLETLPAATIQKAQSKRAAAAFDLVPFVEAWNRICGTKLPKVQGLSADRRKNLPLRLAELTPDPAKQFDEWVKLCRRIVVAPHLIGDNPRGWTATFDFVMQQSSFLKILEGNYDNRNALPTGRTFADGSPIAPGTV